MRSGNHNQVLGAACTVGLVLLAQVGGVPSKEQLPTYSVVSVITITILIIIIIILIIIIIVKNNRTPSLPSYIFSCRMKEALACVTPLWKGHFNACPPGFLLGHTVVEFLGIWDDRLWGWIVLDGFRASCLKHIPVCSWLKDMTTWGRASGQVLSARYSAVVWDLFVLFNWGAPFLIRIVSVSLMRLIIS